MYKEFEQLLSLMKENPDLPVIPMIDAEICADDSGYWMGKWNFAEVHEYLIPKNENESLIFKDECYSEEALEKYLTTKEFDSLLEEDDNAIKKVYNELPWKKAIFVYISLPDVE